MVCDFRMCIYLDFSLMASVLVFEVTSTSQGHMSHLYPIEFTHCGLKHFFLPLFFFFFLEYDPRKTTYSSCCAKCSSPENWLSLICLTFWAYLLLGSRSGRETIQKAWRQEEISALLAGFLCLKPAKESFV